MSGPRVDLSFLIPRFLARLDERLRRISAAMDTIGRVTGEPIESLMREFHSLAGIGGTYGFPEVSVLAREGELLTSVALFEGRSLQTAEVAILRAGVARLDEIRRHAEAALRPSSTKLEQTTPDRTGNAGAEAAAPLPAPSRSDHDLHHSSQLDSKMATR